MQFNYEFIKHQKGLPFKTYFVNVRQIPYHWHSDLEIMWVLKGSVKIQSKNGEYLLTQGDVFIVNTYDVHSLYNTEEDNIVLGIQANTQLIKNIVCSYSEICFLEQYIKTDNPKGKQLKIFMANIMLSMHAEGIAALLNSTAVFYNMLAELVNQVKYKSLSQNSLKIKEHDFERLQGIISFINENYQYKISLQQIADMYYISRYHLSRFIKNKLGIGFQEFLNRVRLTHAVEFIYNTDITIIDIAENCGFSDVKYLNKLVKESYGMTPLQLRVKFRQSHTPDNNTKEQFTDIYNESHRLEDSMEGLEVLKAFLKN